MEIKYLSSLEESAEPHIRQYSRSKTYSQKRWLESFGMIIGGVGSLLLITYIVSKELIPIIILLPVALILGSFGFYRYPTIVRSRILKYIKRESGDNFHREITYIIEKNKITVISPDTQKTFKIKSIKEVKQDNYFIELWFGPNGICVIPKRVFNSDKELDEFLEIINNV